MLWILNLDLMFAETKEWMKTMKAEQKKKLPTETAAFTRDDVAIKISALDREIKYLLNKAKTWVPKKPKDTSNATKSSDNKTATSNTTAANNTDNIKETSSGNTIDIPGEFSNIKITSTPSPHFSLHVFIELLDLVYMRSCPL